MEDAVHDSQYDDNCGTRIRRYPFVDKKNCVKAEQREDYIGELSTASLSAAQGNCSFVIVLKRRIWSLNLAKGSESYKKSLYKQNKFTYLID